MNTTAIRDRDVTDGGAVGDRGLRAVSKEKPGSPGREVVRELTRFKRPGATVHVAATPIIIRGLVSVERTVFQVDQGTRGPETAALALGTDCGVLEEQASRHGHFAISH